MKSHRLALVAFGLLLVAAAGRAQLDTAWVRTFDGGQSDEDWVGDMVVGPDGSVYVAGCAVTGTGYEDIVVRKYDSTGTLAWTDTYAGSGVDSDSAAALVLDAGGNLYVCGSTILTGTGMDMILLKYNSAGVRQWAKTYGRYGSTDDAAYDVCLAGTAVVITGYASDSDPYNTDYCTVWYDGATGDTIRTRFYNKTPEYDEDVAVSVCASATGEVYVTGYSYDEDTDYDIATVRYRADGSQHWARRYNNEPWSDEDLGVTVVYDGASDAAVVGGVVLDDLQDANYFVLKYDEAGDSLWSRQYDHYPAHDEDVLAAVAVDGAGNVYATGTSFDDSTDFDVATIRYQADGMPVWTARHDGEELVDGALGAATDAQGNVLVTGYVERLTSDLDIAVFKYDSAGGRLWSEVYANPASNLEDMGCCVAPGPGGLYVAGSAAGATTGTDYIVIRYLERYHDIAVAGLVVPESLRLADSLEPRAVVWNRGIYPDSCWFVFTNTWAEYAESSWVAVEAGAVETLGFSVWYPETTGTAALVCWSTLAGDLAPENDTARAQVVVWDDTSGIAGLPVPAGRVELHVAPNPAVGATVVRLSLPGTEEGAVRLYDVTGSLVVPAERVEATGAGRPRLVRLDTSRLAAGVYFLKLAQGDREVTRKLVVQH